MKVNINLAALAAVAPAMGDKDIRFYLNGVAVECEKGVVTLIALDGYVMVAARHPGMSYEGGHEPSQTLLPRDFVLNILKNAKVGNDYVTVDVLGDKSLSCDLSLTTIKGTAIDGTYPDWRSVIPVWDAKPTDMAPFNPEVMQVALDASKAYSKRAKTRAKGVHFKPAGEASTAFVLTYTDEASVIGVVMPLRDTSDTKARDAALKAFAER